jgi:hypothetical protein
MGAGAWAVMRWAVPLTGLAGRPLLGAQLAGGVVAGAVVFAAAARLMRMSELRDLLGRAPAELTDEPPGGGDAEGAGPGAPADTSPDADPLDPGAAAR